MTSGRDYERYGKAVSAIDQSSPFTIHPDGTVTQRWMMHYPEGVYLPTDDDGISVSAEPEDTAEWQYLTGYTGQYGYNGAVMHTSEYLGGAMLADMFEILAEDEPQTFVCVDVYAITPETAEDVEGDPDYMGWTVAQYVGSDV